MTTAHEAPFATARLQIAIRQISEQQSQPETPMLSFSSIRRFTLAATLVYTALLTTGCGMGPIADTSAPATVAGTAYRGTVRGGQQPVNGSHIYLYAASTSGYGSASTSLLTAATGNPADPSGHFYVVTDSGGNFGITSDYSCPANSLVYILAVGGNAGSGPNANLAMMTALGACTGSLSASQFIAINELTTVASVYAMAHFLGGPANLGTSSTNTVGLANAFNDVPVLVNTALGTTPGPSAPVGSAIPSAELNTLADILAACINSSGGVATNTTTACGALFNATTYGTAPTDTITAAVLIAENPASNISTLFNLVPPEPPFQPTLIVQPADFTLSVTFTTGATGGNSALAADSQGNVWITNATSNTLLELNHAGAITATAASLATPSAVAVDTANAPWVTNRGNNTVTRYSATGALANTYTGGGLTAPHSISFDSTGTAWIANAASLTSITSGGTLTNYTPSAGPSPLAVAVTPH